MAWWTERLPEGVNQLNEKDWLKTVTEAKWSDVLWILKWIDELPEKEKELLTFLYEKNHKYKVLLHGPTHHEKWIPSSTFMKYRDETDNDMHKIEDDIREKMKNYLSELNDEEKLHVLELLEQYGFDRIALNVSDLFWDKLLEKNQNNETSVESGMPLKEWVRLNLSKLPKKPKKKFEEVSKEDESLLNFIGEKNEKDEEDEINKRLEEYLLNLNNDEKEHVFKILKDYGFIDTAIKNINKFWENVSKKISRFLATGKIDDVTDNGALRPMKIEKWIVYNPTWINPENGKFRRETTENWEEDAKISLTLGSEKPNEPDIFKKLPWITLDSERLNEPGIFKKLPWITLDSERLNEPDIFKKITWITLDSGITGQLKRNEISEEWAGDETSNEWENLEIHDNQNWIWWKNVGTVRNIDSLFQRWPTLTLPDGRDISNVKEIDSNMISDFLEAKKMCERLQKNHYRRPRPQRKVDERVIKYCEIKELERKIAKEEQEWPEREKLAKEIFKKNEELNKITNKKRQEKTDKKSTQKENRLWKLAKKWKESLQPWIRIDLWDSEIWEKWAKAIAENMKLKDWAILSLFRNKIGDDWARAIAENMELPEGVDLDLSGLPPEEMAKISKSLEEAFSKSLIKYDAEHKKMWRPQRKIDEWDSVYYEMKEIEKKLEKEESWEEKERLEQELENVKSRLEEIANKKRESNFKKRLWLDKN